MIRRFKILPDIILNGLGSLGPRAMRPSYVFFYEWEVTDTYPESLACFSQWWPVDFCDPHYPDVTFRTAEHYMMAAKAMKFDPDAAQAIIDAGTPAEAKELGRKVRHFDRKAWNEVADDIVERGNYLKFTQNDRIKKYLLDTGDRIMVEASPTDRIWGIGFSAEDAPGREDEWGTNRQVTRLGELLTCRMGLALTRAKRSIKLQHNT